MLVDSRAARAGRLGGLYPRFRAIAGERAELEHVIVSGKHAQGHAASRPDRHRGADHATAPTARDDVAFWLYYLGLDRRAKGAVHVQST